MCRGQVTLWVPGETLLRCKLDSLCCCTHRSNFVTVVYAVTRCTCFPLSRIPVKSVMPCCGQTSLILGD